MSVCYESCADAKVFPDESGESCIVTVADEARWHLNASAACVFSLATSGKNTDEIAAALEEFFEIREYDLTEDVEIAIGKMLELRILKKAV